MLKRCNNSRLMGYEKETYLYLLFHYTGKKNFKKNPKANDRARPDVTFWAVEYHSPPPRVPASFSHILCKI